MSWRSLFAFDNPNGEVGRQYNATITNLAGTELVSNASLSQNIATFNVLPIGVYSVAMNIPMESIIYNSISSTSFNFWIIGAGSTATTAALFPYNTIVPVYTTYSYPASGGGTAYSASYISVNFIISVTNSNPIYINSSSLFINNIVGKNVRFNSPIWNTTTCIATKMA
jgi:hypothetical protein